MCRKGICFESFYLSSSKIQDLFFLMFQISASHDLLLLRYCGARAPKLNILWQAPGLAGPGGFPISGPLWSMLGGY